MSDFAETNPMQKKTQLAAPTEDKIEVIDLEAQEESTAVDDAEETKIDPNAPVNIPNGGKINFWDLQDLAEVYEAKITAWKEANEEAVEKEKETMFLKSTHLILYKWQDYLSIPTDLSGNILFGIRKQREDGTFDNNRVLFVFHDWDSLFTVALGYMVVLAELAILFAIVTELLSPCKSIGDSVSAIPVALCTMYAASVASDNAMRFFPFEMTCQDPANYCALVEARLVQKLKPIPFAFETTGIFEKDLDELVKSNPEEAKVIQIGVAQDKFQSLVTWCMTCALQLSNLLLLTTVAIVMGTSDSILSLIQNFVSVEIVVHIHEFIPRALRLKDHSPDKFNCSYVEQVALLERMELLRVWYPSAEENSEEKESNERIHTNANVTHRKVFIAFFLYTWFIFTIVAGACATSSSSTA